MFVSSPSHIYVLIPSYFSMGSLFTMLDSTLLPSNCTKARHWVPTCIAVCYHGAINKKERAYSDEDRMAQNTVAMWRSCEVLRVQAHWLRAWWR
jgi:hypothetical protein